MAPAGTCVPMAHHSSPVPSCGEAVQVSTREGPHPGLRAHGGDSQGVSGWGVTNAMPSTTVTFTQASMSRTLGPQPRLHEPGSGAWWLSLPAKRHTSSVLGGVDLREGGSRPPARPLPLPSSASWH